MFLISLLLTVLSSYLIISCLLKNDIRGNLGIICFLLTAFAQLVLTFEILSLFNAISSKNILLLNIIAVFMCFVFFLITKRELYRPNLKKETKYIRNALNRDCLLKLVFLFFAVFIISQLMLALLQPIILGDALIYYLPRCTGWIMTGSINFIDTPDVRELMMPVNMEFLYTWYMLFTKTEQGCAFFAYLGYINAIIVIYNFLLELGFSRRKSLWSVFVFSSFAIIGIMSHTPCADLFIGSLILTSIYLFFIYCKYNNKVLLYFSALAYALALGTKFTSAAPMFPLFVLCCIILFRYKKNDIKKSFIYFVSFFIINLFIFSSYNYILNYIHFGNIAGSNSISILNEFRGGLKGYIFNLINYFFLIFDASGINNFDIYNKIIMGLRTKVYHLFGINYGYISPYFPKQYIFKSELNAVFSLLGFIGLFTFFPSILYLIFNKNRKYQILKYLSIAFVVTVMLFAGLMLFTRFNARYIVTFVVIASPIIACTYIKSNKNIVKWFLCGLMFIYLFYNPITTASPYVYSFFSHLNNLEEFNKNYNEAENIFEYLKEKNTKIAIIEGTDRKLAYYGVKLRLFGNIVDNIVVEKLKEYNLSDYNYIISTTEAKQYASYIIYKEYNPQNYISECTYFDKNKKEIKSNEGEDLTKTIKVSCEIHFDYIISKGFEKDKSVPSSKFRIYKRK